MILLKTADKDDIKKIKKIYRESFPKAERKPFWLIERKVREGSAQILSVKSESLLCGMIITVVYKDLMMVDYFAIDNALRNKGVGTEALQKFLEANSKTHRVFLEVEKPNDLDELKNRRKQFYLRNGMNAAGIEILLFGVPMELMYATEPVTFKEYFELYSNVFGVYATKNIEFIRQRAEN